MKIRATSEVLGSDGMNPVRAKYFIENKICLFAAGSKQEL